MKNESKNREIGDIPEVPTLADLEELIKSYDNDPYRVQKIASAVKLLYTPFISQPTEGKIMAALQSFEDLMNFIDQRGYRNDFTEQREALKQAKEYLSQPVQQEGQGMNDECTYNHSKLELYGDPCPQCGIVEGSDMS